MTLSWGSGAGPLAVLACPPGERHDIPLLCLGLLLGRRGWRVRFLGADTPAPDLAAACRDLRPEALVLSSTTTTRLRGAVDDLADQQDRPRILFGGGGATEEVAEPVGAALLPRDLVEAADALTSLVATPR